MPRIQKYYQAFFLDLAAKGKDAWNAWRRDPAKKDVPVTFARIDFSGAPRDGIDLGFEFGDDADFSGCKWRGVEGVPFAPGRARFSGATFGRRTAFTGAAFGNDAAFDRAVFGDAASFADAAFGDRAYFTETEFDVSATFTSAAFGDVASFAGASFGELASFAGGIRLVCHLRQCGLR